MSSTVWSHLGLILLVSGKSCHRAFGSGRSRSTPCNTAQTQALSALTRPFRHKRWFSWIVEVGTLFCVQPCVAQKPRRIPIETGRNRTEKTGKTVTFLTKTGHSCLKPPYKTALNGDFLTFCHFRDHSQHRPRAFPELTSRDRQGKGRRQRPVDSPVHRTGPPCLAQGGPRVEGCRVPSTRGPDAR